MKPPQSPAALTAAAWTLSLTVAALAVIAWGGDLRWNFAQLSVYQLFPLLGLLAFSLMWAHYPVSALRRAGRVDPRATGPYFSATGWMVLALIVLHPGLLVWQLGHDGFGWPPGSYLYHYVAPGLRISALVGTVCFFIFLAFELHRFFGQRPWWRLVGYATDLAMLGIFYHSITLGTDLQGGWLRGLWWFYGVSLVVLIIYNRAGDLQERRN